MPGSNVVGTHWKVLIEMIPMSTATKDFLVRKRHKSALEKIDKIKILMTNGSLMKVESIAECSPWSNLQYF